MNIQLSDGPHFRTWDQVQAEGGIMPWLLTGHGSLCLEEYYHHAYWWTKISLFTFSTQVRTFFCHFIWTAFNIENTERLDYLKPDSSAVNSSETISQLGQKSSASPPAQGQPQVPTSSSSDAHVVHGSPSFQRATPEELDLPASSQITHERLVELERNLSVLLTAQTERDRRVAQLTDGLERKLSAMLATQTERDQRMAQLTDEFAQNSALLTQAEANAVEGKKRAELELRELQAKLDKFVLSCDHAPEQAQRTLLATSRAAEATESLQRCVPSSRRASPNWLQSIYDPKMLKVVGPSTKQRQTHRAPRLPQIS